MINYLDRAVLGIAAPSLTRDLGLSAAQMGLVFSAFSWSYALLQIPGGISSTASAPVSPISSRSSSGRSAPGSARRSGSSAATRRRSSFSPGSRSISSRSAA
jgi:MFS family permease